MSHYWWGATSLIAFVGVLINAISAYRNDSGFFTGAWERFFNTFAFFTIQSNLLVAISTLLLYLNRDRVSTAFRAFWLSGLVAISITGVVYHWLLAGLNELHGLALIGDLVAHTVVPIMAVLGFFVFGPRGLITQRIVKLTLIFLGLWAAFTVVRGEIVDWYPYPFIDVIDKGYPRVIVNSIGIGVLYFLVGLGYMVIDRLLTNDETDRRVNG